MVRAILVTGGAGQVGTALRGLGTIGGLPIVAPSRPELDLGSPEDIERAVGGAIAAVINCAAFTDVDGAEAQEVAAFALNAEAPGLLAAACNRARIPLVHLSTDYVFAGTLDRPMREDDPVAPQGAYGRTKAEGERRIMAAGGPHLIFRTAWVVSPWRRNFVKTMIRLAGERDEISVVADQQGCPTSAQDLAAALAALLPGVIAEPAAAPQLYHLVNGGEASWFELARYVMERLGDAGRRAASIRPIPTSAYPTPASRPANSRLSTEAFTRRFGIEMRPWKAAVGDVIDQCLAESEELS